MTEGRCEFCNQAVRWVAGTPLNLPGDVRWIEQKDDRPVAELLAGRLSEGEEFHRFQRQVHYREHAETCPRAKELRKRMEARADGQE